MPKITLKPHILIKVRGISYNYVWTHTLSNLPVNCEIESVEIEFRAKVWYWGWNIYEQNLDLLCSDTTVFNTQVFELTPATTPNRATFTRKPVGLLPAQFDWVKNDGTASIFMISTYGGTYYLDYSKITVKAGIPAEVIRGDINNSGSVDLTDAMLAFKVLLSLEPDQAVHLAADENGDGKIGLAEAIYILQKVSGSR